MDLTEQTCSSEVVYAGRIIRVESDDVLLPDGSPAGRDVVRHPGGVGVLALTEDGRVPMVRQFRYPFGAVLLEIPAGKLDRPGEDPLEAGKRELLEETGYTATDYTSLGCLYASPGFCDEIIHLFLARGLTLHAPDPDEDEFLEVELIPLEQLTALALAGELPDSKTQIAVLKAAALQAKVAGK